MIELRNVTKEYSKGNPAINGVSVKIERGEFVFIVGDSGSGKSTLIRLIMKELNPTEGTIIVNGQIALADRYRQTHNIDDLPQRYRSFSVERVDKFISDQDSLMGKFDEYVQSFNGQLKHARIHQTAHLSPLGMGNAVRSDGSVVIAPEFVRQVNILQQAGVSDLMVTAELYNDRDGNQIDGYLTGQQRQDYINMISQLVDLVGDNLVIELGNETNTNQQ